MIRLAPETEHTLHIPLLLQFKSPVILTCRYKKSSQNSPVYPCEWTKQSLAALARDIKRSPETN
jgi:hypothetical protein